MENNSKEFHEGGESKTHYFSPLLIKAALICLFHAVASLIDMCEQIVCGTVRLQNTCAGLSWQTVCSTYTFISTASVSLKTKQRCVSQ